MRGFILALSHFRYGTGRKQRDSTLKPWCHSARIPIARSLNVTATCHFLCRSPFPPSQRPIPIRVVSVGRSRSGAVQALVKEFSEKIRRYCPFEDLQVRSNPKNSRYYRLLTSGTVPNHGMRISCHRANIPLRTCKCASTQRTQGHRGDFSYPTRATVLCTMSVSAWLQRHTVCISVARTVT